MWIISFLDFTSCVPVRVPIHSKEGRGQSLGWACSVEVSAHNHEIIAAIICDIYFKRCVLCMKYNRKLCRKRYHVGKLYHLFLRNFSQLVLEEINGDQWGDFSFTVDKDIRA